MPKVKKYKAHTIGGLPVVDARKEVKLTIIKRDISDAKLKDPTGCVAARACKAHLHVYEAKVHIGRVFLRFSKDLWTRFETPKSLRTEIIAFDRGGRFMPGTQASKRRHKVMNIRVHA